MILYRAKDGAWHRRQVQAGPGHETHDIPTDKSGLFVWLNANFGSGVAATPAEPVDDQPLPAIAGGKEESCPKCKFTPTMAQRIVDNKKRDLNMEAIREWLEQRNGWELTTVIETITFRLTQLAAAATGAKK
jgi:hypothetical protein